MVSITDPVASPFLAGGEGGVGQPGPTAVPAPAGAVGGPGVRIDLFRGLALWLIFIDHVSPDLLTWFTIRSYGFSDAAEIFIFISGYTAAFVYGRAMLGSGFLVASARVLRRVWEIFVFPVFVVLLLLVVGALR